MKFKSLASLSALAGLAISLGGCADQSRVELPPSQVIIEKKTEAAIHPEQKYFLGQVQVQVGRTEQMASLMADMKAKEGISLSVIDKIPGQPIYLLEVNSLNSVPEVVKTLKEDWRVVGASKNHYVQASDIRVNDPLVPTQWGLSNSGQEAPHGLAGKTGADIGMENVTAEGSYDTVVGVIDTGIDYTHEDLALTDTVDGQVRILPGSNIWINPNEIPGNGINDDNNGDPANGLSYVDDVYGYNFVGRNGDPRDDQGHGTHVSGVIGALRNNFKGVMGINKKVSLMALKFLSAEGGGSDFDAQLAIYYAIDMKKRFPEKRFVLSNSWGASGRESKNGDDDDFLLRAFADASRAGILSIAAAGNEGVSNRFSQNFPANYAPKIPNFISVAAVNNLDQLTSFSSYGSDNVQIAAPGMLIQSTVPTFVSETGYAAWSGTSMATPHVSGAAALVWSENPTLTAEEVQERLLATADDLPQLRGSVSHGRLNVRRALANDRTMKIQPVAEEVPYVVEPPKGSDATAFEVMTKIEHKGAAQIQVCFSRISLDADSDWIEILGADYRVKDTITGRYEDRNWKGEVHELCSAPVQGDSLYIRLSNQGSGGLQGYQTKFLKVVKNESK